MRSSNFFENDVLSKKIIFFNKNLASLIADKRLNIWTIFQYTNYASEHNLSIQDLPEFFQILNSHKEIIIKYFLTTIANENERDMLSNILDNVNHLIKLDIKWPELDIIKRSLLVGQPDALHEEDQIESILGYITDELNVGNVRHAMHYIHRYKLTVENTPKLETLLDRFKFHIINYILTQIKCDHDNQDKMESVKYFVLDRLNATKINWPEIITIEHSLSSIVSNILNEIDNYEQLRNEGIITHVVREFNLGVPLQALHTIRSFNLNIENTPGLEDLLNKQKTELMKLILTMLKQHASNYGQLLRINGVIDTLILTKIKWPEFGIIKRSVNSQIELLTNQ